MSPRTVITAASQRPQDPTFAFFVRFYLPRVRGIQVFWTDTESEAVKFASRHRCYARPAVVQLRSESTVSRTIGLSEAAATVVT